MEYSFRYPNESETATVLLEDYNFIIRQGSREEAISYASVVSVRIDKSFDEVYKLHLYPDGHSPIVVTSLSPSKGDQGYKGIEYALFVRVLHHHLKGKSRAAFRSGGNFNRILQWSAVGAALSFLISLATEYEGINLINVYVQALALTLLAIVMLVAFNGGKIPKTYSPTDIPLQYLPT